MALHFGGPGVTPTNKLGFGNRISLAAGTTWIISPAGPYYVLPGPYTSLQIYDPILQSWISVGGASTPTPRLTTSNWTGSTTVSPI